MAKKISVEAVTLLQLGVALYVATLGIMGIAHWDSNLNEFGRQVTRFFGGRSDPTSLVIAIIELACGVVVAGVLFVRGKSRIPYLLTLAVCVLWLVYAVVVLARQGFESPDFVSWLNALALYLAILMGLWMVNRRYA